MHSFRRVVTVGPLRLARFPVHGASALHVLFLQPLMVFLQMRHGVTQSRIVRMFFHVMTHAFHGMIQPMNVLTLCAAFEALLGMAQTFVTRIFLESLFDARDGLFPGLFLFPRLGLLPGLGGGGFVGRRCQGCAGD